MSLPREEIAASEHAEVPVYTELDNPALLQLSRRGDADAFAELFVRHRDYAVRVASRASHSLDPEDVASEAFARVWTALSHGRGPERAFCPYLAAAVRNVAINWHRDSREVTTDPILLETATEDSTSAGIAEADLISEAFTSLPPRWRSALWAVDVEGTPVQDFADSSGMSANAASALCLRAREGLKTAWLQAHVHRRSSDPDCQWVLERLGAHARPRQPAGQRERVEAHLFGCPRCRTTRDRLSVLAGTLKTATLFAGTGATILLAKSVGAAATGATAGVALGSQLTASAEVGAHGVAGLAPVAKTAAGLEPLTAKVLGLGSTKIIAGAASVATVAAVVIGFGTAGVGNTDGAAALIVQATPVVSAQPSTTKPTPTTPQAQPLNPSAVTTVAKVVPKKVVTPKKPAASPTQKTKPPKATPTSVVPRQAAPSQAAPQPGCACHRPQAQGVVIQAGVYAGFVTPTSTGSARTVAAAKVRFVRVVSTQPKASPQQKASPKQKASPRSPAKAVKNRDSKHRRWFVRWWVHFRHP